MYIAGIYYNSMKQYTIQLYHRILNSCSTYKSDIAPILAQRPFLRVVLGQRGTGHGRKPAPNRVQYPKARVGLCQKGTCTQYAEVRRLPATAAAASTPRESASPATCAASRRRLHSPSGIATCTTCTA